MARAAGYAWKRCRRSLRAQRDPAAFAACQARLRELHQAEARHEVAVVYVDECRFSRQAHAPGQPLQAYVRAGALTADLFVLAVNDFCQTLDGPTVLVLDNASIHTAHLVRACHAEWAAKGLTLLFLPPYSPELNHIELLLAPLQALLGATRRLPIRPNLASTHRIRPKPNRKKLYG